mmetsp:Transcript_50085/g.160327  ORF Transcript_50085/g.160327 Transcript_50085/m.160327 type:complete len:226 (-) Transcript_50085:75-752(-)
MRQLSSSTTASGLFGLTSDRCRFHVHRAPGYVHHPSTSNLPNAAATTPPMQFQEILVHSSSWSRGSPAAPAPEGTVPSSATPNGFRTCTHSTVACRSSARSSGSSNAELLLFSLRAWIIVGAVRRRNSTSSSSVTPLIALVAVMSSVCACALSLYSDWQAASWTGTPSVIVATPEVTFAPLHLDGTSTVAPSQSPSTGSLGGPIAPTAGGVYPARSASAPVLSRP